MIVWLLAWLLAGAGAGEDCCPQLQVAGAGLDWDGLYLLTGTQPALPAVCRDTCVYTKQAEPGSQYCFRSVDGELAAEVQCEAAPTTTISTTQHIRYIDCTAFE